MDEIIPNLYLSSLTPATNVPALLAAKITLVLTISDLDLPLPTRRHYLAASIAQQYTAARDDPSQDLLAIFPSACARIESQLALDQGVLVHSGMGMSCGAAVVTAYIMKVRMLGAFEGVEFVRERWGGGMPNLGFVNQLVVWEECGWEIWEGGEREGRWKRAYEEWKGEAGGGRGKAKLITWGSAGDVGEAGAKGEGKQVV